MSREVRGKALTLASLTAALMVQVAPIGVPAEYVAIQIGERSMARKAE